MRSMVLVILGLAFLVSVTSGQGNRPVLTGEASHTRFPGGHAESFKVTHDAWVSKDGNWRAGGYVQHDREKFNGMRHTNTHGGLSITGRFRRTANPLTGEVSHTRFPGGHAESVKVTQDAWVSKDGNWRAGGYVQHDREKFNGMRHSNTHGGLSITGRFRRMASPLTGEVSHTRFPGGHAESVKVTQDAWVSKDGNWRAGGYVQHDREKFDGMRHSNTHGGLSITGRFRRMANPLTGEVSHTRFPGGHAESVKVTHDAWVSKDGNWRAGGYVQHDREKFNGMRHSNTHGGLSITGRFRRMADPLTGEVSHTRFPGGHAESAKITHDAWVSKDGNWRAGGYVQHDREKFNGMRHSNTHGGLSITGRFRRMADPLTGEVSHTRFPGGHAESVKVTQDAWVSKDGNWRAGGYVQHDREKFNGMRHSNTHGGLSITGRFRRMAEPDDNRPTLTGEVSHTRFPGGHAESVKVTQDAWVSKDGNWHAGGYVQHDREKFNGMRHSNTHGGLSITGRF